MSEYDLVLAQLDAARAALFAAQTALDTAEAFYRSQAGELPPEAEEADVQYVTGTGPRPEPDVGTHIPSNPIRDSIFETMGQPLGEDDE